MAKSVAVAWIRIEDYKTVKGLMAGEALPETFHQWLQVANQEMVKLQSKGVTTERVMVRPDEFAAWCDAKKKKRDQTSLKAFAETLQK